jgi:hypothetical protein
MASVTPPLEAAICDMPLLPWKPEFHTKYSPSVLVFTLAIGWYYLNGMWAPNSTTSGIGSAVPVLFILILAAVQTFVIGKQKACPPTVTYGLIAAWVIGILSGTIGFWIAYGALKPGMNAVSMVSTPEVTPPTKEKFVNSLFGVNSGVAFKQQKTNSTDGGGVTMDVAKPSSSNSCKVPDDDTYYVDLYKNGRLITESIGEKLIS